MRFYQLSTTPTGPFTYYPDLKSVKTVTRNLLGVQREDARVKLMEVATDKAGVLELLNGRLPVLYGAFRQWRVTARHRYIEIPADEE